jgi:hypothetical protein
MLLPEAVEGFVEGDGASGGDVGTALTGHLADSSPRERKDGRACARYPTLCQRAAKDGPPVVRPPVEVQGACFARRASFGGSQSSTPYRTRRGMGTPFMRQVLRMNGPHGPQHLLRQRLWTLLGGRGGGGGGGYGRENLKKLARLDGSVRFDGKGVSIDVVGGACCSNAILICVAFCT